MSTKSTFKTKAGANGILSLNAQLEEYEEQAAELEATQPLVEGVTPEGEGEIVETAAVVGEAEDQSAEFEKEEEVLQVADESLESWAILLGTMEAFSKTGGIDSRAAILYNQNQAQIYARLGAEFGIEDAVATETFKQPSGRQTATVLALEDGENKFKQAVKAIWEFIKKWAAKLGELAASWLTATGRTKRRAQALSTKASEAEFGYTLNEKEQSRYGKVFWNGNGVSSVVDASDQIKKQCDKFKEGAFADQTLTIMKQVSEGAKTDKEKWWQTIPKIIAWMRGTEFSKYVNGFSTDIVQAKDVQSQWDKGEGNYYGGEILPGGMRIVFFSSKDNSQAAETDNQFPNVSGDFIRFSKPTDGAKLDDGKAPKNSAEVTKICANVVSICENRANASNSIKEFSKKANAEINKIDTKIKSMKDVGAAASNAARRVANFFRALFSGVAKPFSAMARYAISVSGQMLDVCTLKMKKAKGKGDDSDGDKK